MGNGPGNIKEYIDAFYKYPKLQGGFAWEWANHGLLTKDKQTGDEFYAYGGDFGEVPHDSTFVMDGLVNSDHEPNPGLTEYKKAIEPVQLLAVGHGRAKFINRYDFIDLDHLSAKLTITSDPQGESAVQPIAIPSGVGPGQTFDIDLPSAPDGSTEAIATVVFQLEKSTPWLDAGFEIANAQIPLREPATLKDSSSPAESKLSVTVSAQNTLKVETSSSTWTFNTLHGTLTSWIKDSTELISKAPEINFFRAPTDNDIPQDGWDWKDRLLHLAKPSTRKVEWSGQGDGEFTITVHQRVAPPVLSWSIECILTYHFLANGSLDIRANGSPKGENLPRTLPRIGLVMELPKEWQQVQWFGRGPGESYRDSKLSQLISTYSVSNINDLWVDYEVPQESSNRTDTRWLKLQHQNKSSSLLVQFSDATSKERRLFDFQASHYRMNDVAEAGHPYELKKKKREEVVLRLDYEHHGLGSGSCGPRTRDEYALLTKKFEFDVSFQ